MGRHDLLRAILHSPTGVSSVPGFCPFQAVHRSSHPKTLFRLGRFAVEVFFLGEAVEIDVYHRRQVQGQ